MTDPREPRPPQLIRELRDQKCQHCGHLKRNHNGARCFGDNPFDADSCPCKATHATWHTDYANAVKRSADD